MLIELKNLISKYNLNITGVVHVGAHYGIFEEKDFRECGVRNQMFFEPIVYGWNTLKNNFEGKYPIHNVAVGNENKKVIMHCDHDNSAMSSSILTPKKHLEYYPNVHFVEDIEVDMVRLDDYLNIDLMMPYNMLNIDVQGYELEVLKGATKLINRYIDYVYCEVNREELYENCSMVEDVDKFLSDFHRVETAWTPNGFGDALYVRYI